MQNLKYLLLFCLFTCFSAHAQKTPEAKSGWLLGAQSYTFRLFTLDEALRKIDSCGLKNVEIYPGQTIGGGIDGKVDFKMAAAERAKLKALFKKYGITATAFGVVNAKDEAEWTQLFEFVKDLGIKVVNTEPAPEQFSYLIPLAEKNKVRLGLHNHPKPSRYWHPDTVQKYMGNSEFVGACVDIGHYVRSGLDPVAAMKQLDGKIVSFHFKDVVPGPSAGKYHDVIWGNGQCKVDEVIAEMKRQKFKGPISAEYEYNWEHSAPEVAKSAAYFREAYKRAR
ncbi:MAG: endonuclease [Cytophagaceae bacterium SCN 52-12]|nr:MAG: endonuclease [Cytophagaceae bacterium SCN 52-12]